MTRAAAIAVALLAACTTTQPEPTAGPTAVPSASPSPSPSTGVLPVIAVEGAPALDGMRLAAEQVGITLDVSDPSGDPAGALRRVLSSKPAVILVVDQPAAIEAARLEIEAARVPVVLVGGDLYSDRALFRYAFQVSTPLTWQARVLAHYLASDRGDEQVAVAGERRISQAALAEEGLPPVEDLADTEAVLALRPGPPTTDVSEDVQLALGADALAFTTALPAGTVASGPYTWAGWAEPIPRVAKFRERFSAMFGHEPGLAEQEGYEAVQALAEAMERADGRGGEALVRELESFRDETFSSTPIRLGPDDHVFAEQSHLGLFAVEADDVPAPGEDLEPVPWRPLMRTFTTNGKRVNLADRDVRVFFPNWGPRRPRPNYWRSEYGIVTRPDDPLH
jgi:Periplasmic binding protein